MSNDNLVPSNANHSLSPVATVMIKFSASKSLIKRVLACGIIAIALGGTLAAAAERPRIGLVLGGGGCLLYTSDAADERSSVDLGGRRIIKKKKDT